MEEKHNLRVTKILNNFIMRENKDEQIQECFAEHEIIDYPNEEEIDLKIKIFKRINEQMPANELCAVGRPSNIAPRTFFLERPLYLLKGMINQPCQEQITKIKLGRLIQRVTNSKKLSIDKYFSRQKFRCVYNKIENYRSDCKSFSGRLKSIDSLIDYNWKSFKELQIEINLFEDHLVQNSIDSDFESGNICKAFVRVQQQVPKEYNLVIQNDLNTYGYNNWFFFRFRNVDKGITKFNIVNIIKKTSFYSQGMLISIFSVRKKQFQNKNWFKGGDSITFSHINFLRNHHQQEYYYSLQFQYDFDYQNDEVYFAFNQPYTYTRLANLIEETKQHFNNCQVKTIGYTIANNAIPMFRFSNYCFRTNDVILVFGRQHPCQTVGSFIAETIIRQLSQKSQISQLLLKQFQIIVIPMINPDGVIHGMSRTNMAGLDLNRQWSQTTIKQLVPQTMKIKQFLTNLSKTKKIKYVIDLHGHGKKLNSFCFCCKNSEGSKDHFRLFPFALKKKEERFHLSSCTYGITKDKQNTLRSMTNNLGIVHSYTLETSQFGWKQNGEIKHFNQADFKHIGKSLLESLVWMEGQPEVVQNMFGMTKANMLIQLLSVMQSLQRQQKFNTNDNLSDSDPEGDRLEVKDLLNKCENKIIKKKIQQTFNSNNKPKLKQSDKNLTIFTSANKQTLKLIASKDSAQNSIFKNYQVKKTHSKQTASTVYNCGSKDEWQSLDNQRQALNEKKKERRRLITTRNVRQNKNQSEQFEMYNLARPKLHSRMRTDHISKERKGMSTTVRKKGDFKTQIYSTHVIQKLKDQMKHKKNESADLQRFIKKQPHSLQDLQMKFNSVKKESLKYFLTDTISVFKISPSRQEHEQKQKAIKHVYFKFKTEGQTPSTQAAKQQPTPRTSMQCQQQQKGKDKDKLAKLKKFKQFVIKEGNNFPKRASKQNNSVYYYFPVL